MSSFIIVGEELRAIFLKTFFGEELRGLVIWIFFEDPAATLGEYGYNDGWSMRIEVD